MADRGGRELGHPEHTTDVVHPGSHVQLEMGVDSTGDTARNTYSWSCHPFSPFGQGVARDAPRCDAGAIALRLQGGPPHLGAAACHCLPWRWSTRVD